MFRAISTVLMLSPGVAVADSLVAARVIHAKAVILPEDVTMVAADIPNALTGVDQALGQEARITIFPGRPVHSADIGPSAVVERNQMVPLAYQVGALTILTEGRALERAATGQVIPVMNLTSRTTVMGQIGPDGVARVAGQSPGNPQN